MTLRITLVLAALLLLPAGCAFSQAIFTEFTGTEMAGGPPFDPGTVTCPGGKETGLWPYGPPCTPGSRVHSRGMKAVYYVQTTDPRFHGEETVTVNGNFENWRITDPGSGKMWGTIILRVMSGTPGSWTPTGEIWEGTFTGTRTVSEEGVVSDFHDVAHGSGGAVEGLQAQWKVTLNPVSGAGDCRGRILAPGGK